MTVSTPDIQALIEEANERVVRVRGQGRFLDGDLLERLAAALSALSGETETEWGIRLEAYPTAAVVPVASKQRAKAHAVNGRATAMQRQVTRGPWIEVNDD